MKVEEGACVEGLDVMFLCQAMLGGSYEILYEGICVPAMCLVAQSASAAIGTCSCPPCALAGWTLLVMPRASVATAASVWKRLIFVKNVSDEIVGCNNMSV